jgi:uncharacterized membrane protein
MKLNLVRTARRRSLTTTIVTTSLVGAFVALTSSTTAVAQSSESLRPQRTTTTTAPPQTTTTISATTTTQPVRVVKYSVTLMPDPRGGTDQTPADINLSGDIVSNTSAQAATVKGGIASILTPLDPLVLQGHAQALNDKGQAVGWNIITGDVTAGTSGHRRPVLWQNGQATDVLPGGFSNYQGVHAQGINNQGQIVGLAESADNLVDPDIAWSLKNGVRTNLPTLPGGRNAHANAVSDTGYIAGSSSFPNAIHAVLWQTGAPTDLGALPGGLFSEATAVNNAGIAVGVSTYDGGTSFGGTRHAALFRNGTVTDLTPELSSTQLGEAFDINNLNQVVGHSFDPIQGWTPFVWRDGVRTDLNTVIPASLGIHLNAAWAINDKGQIVAGNSGRRSHQTFLLTPL